jgi:hypothetical protein
MLSQALRDVTTKLNHRCMRLTQVSYLCIYDSVVVVFVFIWELGKIIGLYIITNSKDLPGAIEISCVARNSYCGHFPSFQMEGGEGEYSSVRRWVVSKI